MNTEHTPTPWIPTNNASVYQEMGRGICACHASIDTEPTETDHANAEFICLAVNNHEALVEWVKGALPLLDASAPIIGTSIADTARALLNKIDAE